MCGVSLKLEKANKSHHQKNKSVSHLFEGLRYIRPLEKPEFKKYLQVTIDLEKSFSFFFILPSMKLLNAIKKKKAMKSTLS